MQIPTAYSFDFPVLGFYSAHLEEICSAPKGEIQNGLAVHVP